MDLLELLRQPAFWVASATMSIILSVVANLVTPAARDLLRSVFERWRASQRQSESERQIASADRSGGNPTASVTVCQDLKATGSGHRVKSVRRAKSAMLAAPAAPATIR